MYTCRPVTDKCITCVISLMSKRQGPLYNNRATNLSNKMFSSNNQKSIIMQSKRVINNS